MWESKPDDVALPGLAFSTPEPDSTPDAVWEAIPEVEAAPLLDASVPISLLIVLWEILAVESRFPFSLPRWETSV